MKKLEDLAAFLFIIAVAVLSGISVLGVWEVFDKDVIGKSFETLGLLALVAIVVMVAGKFMEKRSTVEGGMPSLPNPAFKTLRQMAVVVLITSASLLAILGVLAIWDVVADKNVLYKSLSSVGVLAFGTFIIVMTALEREGNKMLNRDGKKMSVGGIIFVLFLVYMFFSVFRLFSF